jgi:hypothetical protein
VGAVDRATIPGALPGLESLRHTTTASSVCRLTHCAHDRGRAAPDVSGREQLVEALREAIAAQDGPRLVQVPVTSGMCLE